MKTNNDNFKSELKAQYNFLVQTEKKEQQKRNLIITSILLLTLCITFIGTFFSYTSYRTSLSSKKIKTNEINNHYETLSVTFNDSKTLSLNNITTGYVLLNPKVINITNEGDSKVVYDINLTGVKTSLSNDNLVYTITKENETSIAKGLPISGSPIVTDAELEPQESVRYIINVSCNGDIDLGFDNYYQANLEVLQKNNQVNLLE